MKQSSKKESSPEDAKIIQQIIAAIKELNEDQSVPRNIELKFEKVIKVLEDDNEISIRVDKAQQELDEVADDSNLQPYTRTQIWSVVSLLEKL
ncbi:MAG TPA: UPF0147 family protein [Candidatus Nanoarchaeia archaeon]|nr:UPF0147 family protein [Candidatus Nanoarchaeia archaeon]